MARGSWISHIRRKLRSWLDGYYRARYRLTARLTGRHDIADDLARRGLLVVQIDGLSHYALKAAIERGYAPFLKSLLRRKGFLLKKWYCSAPSNTPAVQAAIMYDNNDDIPGFRWYEKASGRQFSFRNPFDAQIVEQRLREHHTGLLADGSSYANLLSGDAPTSVLTLSTVTDLSVGRTLRGFQIALLIAFNIVAVVRGVLFTVRELFIEGFEWIRLSLAGRIQRGEYLFPLLRVIVGVWFREVITQGVLHEVLSGRRAIYVTFASYDEAAHQRGPLSRSALRSLKGIDHRIRLILRIARRGILRRYHTVILSDHGSTQSMPFHYLYTETIRECIARLLEGEADPGTGTRLSDAQLTYFSVIVRRLQAYERDFARMGRAFVRWLERLVYRSTSATGLYAEPSDDLVVAVSGPLCNVYLQGERRLSDDEISERHPRFIDGLVQHDGIGLVATTSGETVILRSRQGEMRVGPDGVQQEGDVFGELRLAAEEMEPARHAIARIARMANSGDVILLGAMKERHVVNFEEQMAAHGGLGGPQNFPFILHPCGMRVPDGIMGPREMHAVLAGAL